MSLRYTRQPRQYESGLSLLAGLMVLAIIGIVLVVAAKALM